MSLAVGILVAATLLLGWELFWRSRGFVPSLTNNEPLWCRERQKVDHDAVVIVGSSRVETGLDPRVLSAALGGHRVVQLGLDGANPIPALLDLARDRSFAGTVVLEYMPRRMFTADSASYARMQEFVGSCSNPSLVVNVEAKMDRAVEKRAAFLNFELEPITILSHIARRRSLPRDSHAILRDDRFLALHFHGHPGSMEKVRDPMLSPPEIEARLAELRQAIADIQQRGGKVVLYRTPVSDGVLRDEQLRYPVETWLPRTSRELDIPVIDFQTVPGLRALDPPDGEHLDATDVPAASEALGTELRRLFAIAS